MSKKGCVMLEILGMLFLYALVMGWINPGRDIDEKKKREHEKRNDDSDSVNRDLFFHF